MSSVSGEYWEAGRWHDGPQGTGPATLTFAQEISVSKTAFGQVEVGDGVLTSSVGYDVGVSYAQQAAYTINIPSGMTEEIVWHAWYHQNAVDEQEVLPPRSIVVGTATCYTREFSHFGYRTRVLSG